MIHANDIPFAKHLDSIRAPCRHNTRHLKSIVVIFIIFSSSHHDFCKSLLYTTYYTVRLQHP